MNRRSISGLAVPMVLLVLAMAVTSLPAAAVAQVSIGDASAIQGARTTTDIGITQLTGQLGAATIVLEYDADVKVVSVTPGTMGDFAAAPAIDNANHRTTLTWYKATGVTGDQTFAQVELEALGATGETSPLDLTITTFDSTGGAVIGVNDDDGTFTVSGVSQDAIVSIGDASAIQGARTTTDIGITQLTGQLGAATIVLEYDADVKVVSVTPGTMGDFAAAPAIDNANHRTTLTWYKATGVTGDQTFAQVELEALGATGETSPLDLTITTFDSTGGAVIGVNDDDGTFTVSGVSQDAIVSIGDASAIQGARTTTDISITQLTGQLGAATIVLEYDADVKVVSVTPGTMGDFAAAPAIDNANHRTTLTWYKATGVTGDQTFAQVELEALGATGETSPLDLTITTFDSTGGAVIGVNDDDGTFTVGAPNNPPTVTVTSPLGGTVSGTIGATATATDTDGTVTQVAFYLMPAGTLIGTDTNAAGGWSVPLDTTTAADGTGYRIKAVATDNEGATGDDTGGVFAIDNTCPCDFCLDLDAGWNFVSVPRTLNGSNDANTVFNLVSGETCLYYDCVDGWKSNSAVSVVPCQGYWVGKVASDQICLDFDPGTGSNNPPEQELCQGWNMVGHIHTNSMSVGEFASATTLGDNIAQIWQWDQTNGWEGYPFGDFADMTPGRGYWILVGEEDMMYGTI